jgi:hypothetical protein
MTSSRTAARNRPKICGCSEPWRRCAAYPRVGWGEETTTISDKALAAVDSEWRTAREVFAILDEGAYQSTVAALVRACGCWQDRNDAMTRTET